MGIYPYADGHSWAETDIDHAAQLCEKVALRRLELSSNPKALDPSRGTIILAEYRKRFSFAEVGARCRERLTAIYADWLL